MVILWDNIKSKKILFVPVKISSFLYPKKFKVVIINHCNFSKKKACHTTFRARYATFKTRSELFL